MFRNATRPVRAIRQAQRVVRRNFNNKSNNGGSNRFRFIAAGLIPVSLAAILLLKPKEIVPFTIYEVKLGKKADDEDADDDEDDEDEEETEEEPEEESEPETASESGESEEETTSDSEVTKVSSDEGSDEEAPPNQSAAYNPETGEINWDCPCLGGMAEGPCGDEFKEAFACFVYSETEPKGIDCIEKFQDMRSCFRKYPEHYKDELFEDEEADVGEPESIQAVEAVEPEHAVEALETVQESAKETVDAVKESASDIAEAVTESVQETAEEVIEAVTPSQKD